MEEKEAFNMSWEMFSESKKMKKKTCAKALTWQSVFLVGILTAVSLFSLYSLIRHKIKTSPKNQTNPELAETWVYNEDYVPTNNDTKNLTFTEELALDLVNKMARSGKVIAKMVTRSEARNLLGDAMKYKIKCWRKVYMNVDGQGQMGELVGGLRVGRIIAIRGRVALNPKSFEVSLLMGNSSLNDVALQLKACLSGIRNNSNNTVILRNSLLSGVWGVEEYQLQEEFPFAPNFFFEMKICCGADAFTVSVNNIDLLVYKYRVDLDQINHVSVSGDIKLMDVKIM